MDRLKSLFSVAGRTSRRNYWRLQNRLILASAAVWCLTMFATMAGGWLGAIPLMLLAPIFVAAICLCLRRLHDRGRSAWWFILFIPGPPLLLGVAYGLEESVGGLGAALADLPLSLGAVGLTVWAWVEIGFRRGTRGPNAFGPDPV